MQNIFKNKKILITGATGTIGSSLVMKIFGYNNFKVIRAMSNDENGLSELLENMDTNFKSFNLDIRMRKRKFRIFYGDVRDYSRCLSATKDVDIVIHAAAMKHVSICEYNPLETIKTNVEGTKNIIKASVKNKVKKLLFISTDKAAYPSNDMGRSKLKAEKIALNSFKLFKNKNTKISCVRFGNILGSRGSVLPKFINQIKKQKKIKISSKKMTRFIMTINDATNLIFKSLRIMNGNEIFIFKSMYSIKIYDLAKVLQKYFMRKYKRISIQEIGVNTKEKYYESLMTKNEFKYSKETKDMYIIEPNYKSKNKISNYKYVSAVNSKETKNLDQKNLLKILNSNFLLN